MTTDDPIFGGRVFYVENGVRHWVVSASYFDAYGLAWPADVRHVTVQGLRALRIGGQLPWPWKQEDMLNPPKTDWTSLRELSACTLHGRGIEFGAGTAPFCVPPHCHVDFADAFTKPQLQERSYRSQLEANPDFVDLQYVTTIEEMNGVLRQSLDFVIACHVIEHTRNPIKAIARSFECLKPGGHLLLVVPDKRLTFDNNRAPTTLAHLIDDYRNPSAERDEQHYYDFWRNVVHCPEQELEVNVRSAIANNTDLHFHVWTYDTFLTLISYIRQTVASWSSVWSHPPGTGDIANEFYFLLTK